MRYTPEHNEEARERILTAAGRLFRRHGIAAVGLAKIMGEADLTVGTFYTHFKSKEDLVRQALLLSLQTRHADLEDAMLSGDIEKVVRKYLSPEHRDAPAIGCAAASLASEVARHPRPTRQTFTKNMEPTYEVVADLLSKRRCKRASHADAAAFWGLLVGTMQLARATPDADESAAILEAGVHAALRLANG